MLTRVAVRQEYPTGNREDFISKLKNGDFNDVLVIYRGNDSTKVRPNQFSNSTPESVETSRWKATFR